jgi:hypothetical protein
MGCRFGRFGRLYFGDQFHFGLPAGDGVGSGFSGNRSFARGVGSGRLAYAYPGFHPNAPKTVAAMSTAPWPPAPLPPGSYCSKHYGNLGRPVGLP